MNLNGDVYGAQAINASSNGALTTGTNANLFASSGDVTLFSSGDMNLGGQVTAFEGNLNFTTYNNLTVTGTASAGQTFSLTSYFGAVTVNGELDANGGLGTVSTLSATDRDNGTLNINGTVNVRRRRAGPHRGHHVQQRSVEQQHHRQHRRAQGGHHRDVRPDALPGR